MTSSSSSLSSLPIVSSAIIQNVFDNNNLPLPQNEPPIIIQEAENKNAPAQDPIAAFEDADNIEESKEAAISSGHNLQENKRPKIPPLIIPPFRPDEKKSSSQRNIQEINLSLGGSQVSPQEEKQLSATHKVQETKEKLLPIAEEHSKPTHPSVRLPADLKKNDKLTFNTKNHHFSYIEIEEAGNDNIESSTFVVPSLDIPHVSYAQSLEPQEVCKQGELLAQAIFPYPGQAERILLLFIQRGLEKEGGIQTIIDRMRDYRFEIVEFIREALSAIQKPKVPSKEHPEEPIENPPAQLQRFLKNLYQALEHPQFSAITNTRQLTDCQEVIRLLSTLLYTSGKFSGNYLAYQNTLFQVLQKHCNFPEPTEVLDSSTFPTRIRMREKVINQTARQVLDNTAFLPISIPQVYCQYSITFPREPEKLITHLFMQMTHPSDGVLNWIYYGVSYFTSFLSNSFSFYSPNFDRAFQAFLENAQNNHEDIVLFHYGEPKFHYEEPVDKFYYLRQHFKNLHTYIFPFTATFFKKLFVKVDFLSAVEELFKTDFFLESFQEDLSIKGLNYADGLTHLIKQLYFYYFKQLPLDELKDKSAFFSIFFSYIMFCIIQKIQPVYVITSYDPPFLDHALEMSATMNYLAQISANNAADPRSFAYLLNHLEFYPLIQEKRTLNSNKRVWVNRIAFFNNVIDQVRSIETTRINAINTFTQYLLQINSVIYPYYKQFKAYPTQTTAVTPAEYAELLRVLTFLPEVVHIVDENPSSNLSKDDVCEECTKSLESIDLFIDNILMQTDSDIYAKLMDHFKDEREALLFMNYLNSTFSRMIEDQFNQLLAPKTDSFTLLGREQSETHTQTFNFFNQGKKYQTFTEIFFRSFFSRCSEYRKYFDDNFLKRIPPEALQEENEIFYSYGNRKITLKEAIEDFNNFLTSGSEKEKDKKVWDFLSYLYFSSPKKHDHNESRLVLTKKDFNPCFCERPLEPLHDTYISVQLKNETIKVHHHVDVKNNQTGVICAKLLGIANFYFKEKKTKIILKRES